MAEPNSVKAVEICRVAPKPGAQNLFLPLTYFDSLWLRFPPVQRLYFYQPTSSSSTTDSLLVAYLKTSLSHTLQHFAPLAGNLKWPHDSPRPLLSYVQGDAVSLTIAESTDDESFDHLSGNSILVESRAYHPLVPHLESSHERAAAMALQITLFPGRGFAIGTSMHHAVLDGKTSVSFVKSWAHACSKLQLLEGGSSDKWLLPEQLKPLYDRRVIHDPTGLGLESIYLNEWQNMDGPDNRSLKIWELRAPPEDSVRGIFEFTRAQIQTLRQMVVENKVSDDLHLSTFSLVCAYTWVCLVKAQELDAGKTSYQAFTVDCRSRLDPPVPENYFGNCTRGVLPFAEAKELLGGDGLVAAVAALSEAIKGLDKNGVLNGVDQIFVSKVRDFLGVEGLYSTAGSYRFQIYGTDFGWGAPKKVEVVSIDRTGAFSLSDSKNGGGGVEVGVVLKKQVMEAFASLFAKGFGEHTTE